MPERADRVDQLVVAAREALWHDGALLVRLADVSREPDLSGLWAALAPWHLPLMVALPPSLVEATCAAAPIEPSLVSLEAPTVKQREVLWRILLPAKGAVRPKLSDGECIELAARYDFLPGILARAVRRAIAECSLGRGVSSI